MAKNNLHERLDKLQKIIGQIITFVVSFGSTLFGIMGYLISVIVLAYVVGKEGGDSEVIVGLFIQPFGFWVGIIFMGLVTIVLIRSFLFGGKMAEKSELRIEKKIEKAVKKEMSKGSKRVISKKAIRKFLK